MRRLPLTLFEQYLFHEDKRSYPCWILVRCRFAGSFDRDHLQRAWEDTTRRHPLLKSIVRRDWWRGLVWEEAPGYRPTISWDPVQQPSGWPRWEPIDLTRAPGIRLLVSDDGNTAHLFVQVHHAICDGIGIYRVIHDLLVQYARVRRGSAESQEMRREVFSGHPGRGRTTRERLKLASSQLIGLLATLQLSRQAPVPLLPHNPAPNNGPLPQDLPAYLYRCLDQQEFQKLRDIAKRLKVTINDLLIRDLSAAIGSWREAVQVGSREDWIRMAIPVSLRHPAEDPSLIANRIGIVVIDRRAKSLHNRERLLRRASEDMNLVKRHQLGFTFMILLALRRLIPGGIRRYAESQRCQASVIMSNLGILFPESPLRDASNRIAVTGAVLEDVATAGPLRPATCALFVMTSYAGKFKINLSYDPRAISQPQAEALLSSLMEQLALTIS